MSTLSIQYHRGGVYLPALGLWLDAHEPQTGADKVFISHAHADHTAAHREVILSKPTARLLQARLGGDWIEHVLPFGQTLEFNNRAVPFRLTLLPAGHIFGSAMALVQAEGESLLYTGDFKLRRGLSAEPCDPSRARGVNALIMETTYGRPAYQFPPTADVVHGVVRFCRDALDNEETPVLLGYSLGKSQELLRSLADASLPIAVHGSVFKLTQIYQELGQRFPAYERYDAENSRGKVLVCPPSAAGSALLRKLGPVRTAVLTGWAVDPNCRFRYQVDAAFPLSDHADFLDLVGLVKQVEPKKIYTLHGFAADFAQTLRDLGYDAQALSEDDQFALPLAYSQPSGKHRARQRRSQPSVISHQMSADSGQPSVVRGPSSATRSSSPVVEGLAVHDKLATISQGRSTTGPSFSEFAATCAKIASTSKKLEKTAALADYLKTLSARTLGITATWFTGHPFPPIENKALQLGWALIRDALCAVGEVDHADFGRVYLKHSDLGETAFEILQQIVPAKSALSVIGIQRLFDQLHAARGANAKLPLIVPMLRHGTALEGKYLVKILTGDLRIGLKEGLVEEAIAQAFAVPLAEVKNANLLLGNIGETTMLAAEKKLSSASLVPLRPVKFMLASPEESAAEVWKRVVGWSAASAGTAADETLFPSSELQAAIQSAPVAWVEDKYDGIRCQLHKWGPRVALYSRDLKDITATFLELTDAMQSAAADFVIDGEIVAMRDEQVLPFSELQKRLGRREGDLFLREEIPICFIAFDLLWREGESFLDRPLRLRREALEQTLPPPLRLAAMNRAFCENEVEVAFTVARQRGNEGLVIKDPASVYSPGRRGLAWLKLKKAYASLDCVVVGAEFGHGKRKHVLSDYTFAVRDEANGELKTIGKAYSGLTDAEIAQLTQHFLGKVRFQKGRYHEVEPAIVLEIAFDAVQPSNRHSSGLALRFPRIVRIRTDRTVADIDTLETARRLVKS